jgi:hypothetical protein
MKRILFMLTILLFAFGVYAQWLPDSIINDRNTVNRTGYNNARGIARGIASHGNDIYAVWTEAGYRIVLRAKVGGKWLACEEVSVGSPGGIYGTSTYPCLALHGNDNDIHVVWEDYRTADFEVFYRRFSNGWGTPINLTGDTAQSRSAVITITTSGRRFLIWQDSRTGIYEIYAKIYENGSWGVTEKLSSAVLYAGYPTIAHHNESVYVVWEQMEYSGYELYYCTHTGGAWSSPQRITNSEGLSQYPSLCITPSGIPHLVFADNRNGSFDIYHTRYSGSAWSGESLLTQGNPGEALYPQIAADPYGNLHLVWSGNSEGNYEIYYRRYLSSGQWSADTLLSSTDALSSLPHLAATIDGSIHVMWYDWMEDPVFVSPHIRYRRYDATLDPLSSTIATEITSHGVRITASITNATLTLFRIEEPFPIPIEHLSSTDDRIIWYDELPPGCYQYVVQMINGSTVHYTPLIEVRIPERPPRMTLSLTPNPFSTSTTMALTGMAQGAKRTEVVIYDITGRRVRDFILHPSSFILETTWDGGDNAGKVVSPGIYFVQWCTEEASLTEKVIKF